jgi:hypothetical protein
MPNQTPAVGLAQPTIRAVTAESELAALLYDAMRELPHLYVEGDPRDHDATTIDGCVDLKLWRASS